MRACTGHATHQDRGIDLEEVVADRPADEGRDRAGDEADQEDLERDRTGQLREQAVAGVDADDRDEDHETEVLEDVARRVRRVAEETQPRRDRRHDHARDQQAAGIAEANLRSECRELDEPDQQAEDHADGQGQQVRGRARTRDATEHFSGFLDRALEADNGEDVHPLQLGLQADRERHAAAFVVHDLQLAGERRVAERDELAVDDLLVGHKDFGLVERNIERLLVRDFRTDQAHLVGQAFDLAAERDHVAFLQHD